MSLKKRTAVLLSVSILGLALLTHFIFNITVYAFLKEQHIIPTLQRHIIYFIFSMLLAMSVLGIILYNFIDKLINRRIVKISEDFTNIQGLKDLSIRVAEDEKQDEISSLILNINQTLNKLEAERIKRESMEKQMLTNEKLISIGRLSSSIAHEINNPVMAISNCLTVLKKKCHDETELIQEAIDISETEIKRIRSILSGLLDFHQLEKKDFTTVNLNEIIRQSTEMVEWSKKDDSFKILTAMDKDISVFGSEGKLKQVFVNLLLNSVDAVKEKEGKVRMEISNGKDNAFVEVHVFDNGPGIPSEIKDKIFQPFLTTKEQGTGLGLYISYQIIQNHQGELLYDEDYKDGAHFIVKIPVKEK